MKQVLEYLIGGFLERELPKLTQRNVDLEPVAGKALELIGMRRVGITYLCYQAMQTLLRSPMGPSHSFIPGRIQFFKTLNYLRMLLGQVPALGRILSQVEQAGALQKFHPVDEAPTSTRPSFARYEW